MKLKLLCSSGAAKSAAGLLPTGSRFGPVPIGAKLIVLLALGGVAEHLVSLVNFFKFIFGLFLVFRDIRMVFARQLPKRFPDLVLACLARDSQRLVVILKL